MGVDFHVALHNANWPTTQALQECIDRRGWPVKVGRTDDARWSEPLDQVPGTLGLPVEFKGKPIELEASFVTLSPTQSYAYRFDRPPDFETNGGKAFQLRPNEALKPVDINETLTGLGATGVSFGHGDRVLTLTFRSNKKAWQVGFYVMAALITCFDGYGFELQSGKHGKQSYAGSLIEGAVEMGSGE